MNNKDKWTAEVRFYLYPLELFPSFWGPNSTCDHSKQLTPKHDGHIHAINAMKRHPWRVSNPHDAMLAVLPISVDLYSRGGCPGLEEDTILREVEGIINNSTIFPNIRHVFIGVDFWTKKLGIGKNIMSLLEPSGIWVGMEDHWDCKTSLPYSTNYASFTSMRDPNSWHIPNPPVFGSDRIYSVNFVGQFDERPGYQERVALFTSPKTQQIPSPFIIAPEREQGLMEKGFKMRSCQSHQDTDICISQDNFPSRIDTQKALEKSNFTLLLRGDSFGGDRWSQAMTAGTALIQVLDGEETWDWLPFPCAIPWKDIVLSIPRDKFMKDPNKSVIELISSVTEERLLELQQLSIHYSTDIDWTAYNSRVLENLLRESYYIRCRSFDEYICTSEAFSWHEKAMCIANSRFEYGSRVLPCCYEAKQNK